MDGAAAFVAVAKTLENRGCGYIEEWAWGSGELRRKWTFEAPLSCLHWHAGTHSFCCGDSGGSVHVLRQEPLKEGGFANFRPHACDAVRAGGAESPLPPNQRCLVFKKRDDGWLVLPWPPKDDPRPVPETGPHFSSGMLGNLEAWPAGPLKVQPEDLDSFETRSFSLGDVLSVRGTMRPLALDVVSVQHDGDKILAVSRAGFMICLRNAPWPKGIEVIWIMQGLRMYVSSVRYDATRFVLDGFDNAFAVGTVQLGAGGRVVVREEQVDDTDDLD